MLTGHLRDLPIKRRLAFLGLATAGIALFIMSLLLATTEFFSKREHALDDLNVKADLVSQNAAHALVFSDERTAALVLGELRIEHSIVYAAILDSRGAKFAETHDSVRKTPPLPFPAAGQHVFSGRHLLLSKAMVIDGDTIGTLWLQKDMAVAYRELAEEIAIVYATSLIAILIAALFFQRFQRSITAPIQELARVVAHVTQAEDYQMRATVNSRDELGQLGNGFNAMLETIAQRDTELANSNIRLEETVFQRTEELEKANRELRRQIAEREHAERQLQELNENLAQRIQEEVAQNREKDHLLIQQSRLAAMGEMVHNIAHQWRQPLNTLGLIFQNLSFDYNDGTLDRDAMNAEAAKAMKLIHGMSDTIDEFRNFFRPDQVAVDFDMGKAVEEALAITEASLLNHGIQLEKSLQTGLMVRGHANQFAQAVLNLVANAKDAILANNPRNGQIAITLHATPESAVFAIEDNGGGIPAELLDKIYDPYFTTKEQGSGIGLYMTKMIVERNLEGRLEVARIDGGTRFTLAIPLILAEAEAPPKQPRTDTFAMP